MQLSMKGCVTSVGHLLFMEDSGALDAHGAGLNRGRAGAAAAYPNQRKLKRNSNDVEK